jgi:hypothetical protein
MTRLDFEKTPSEKATHVEANFGVNSLYARSMRLLARLAGDHPSKEKLEESLTIVEAQVDEYLREFKPQS